MRSNMLTFARLGDHYRYHEQYEKSGIPVYAPFLDGEPPTGMVKGIWNFTIKPFENPHGESTSFGFYIQHDRLGKLLFITDAEYVKYDFSTLKVNHILIECNWQDGMVDYDSPNFRHKVTGHMSLQTCKEFVKHNASDELHNVILIHWSETTIDLDHAVEEIKSVCDVDVNVVIAEPGLEMELKKGVL